MDPAGSWIRDLFGELLEAKILEDSLIGIDITDKQFWVPDREDEQLATISYSHLKLLIANVCSLPEDWSSKFKLVHQRLLVAALTRQEWGRCVREISRVLQPGGWVQLAEVGNADFTTPLASEWVQLGRALFDARGLVWDLKPLLTELLSEAGLTDIRVQHFELPLSPTHHGSEGMQGATNFIEVYRGVKALMVKMFPERFHGDPAEYDKLLTGMTREWDESGATMRELLRGSFRRPNTSWNVADEHHLLPAQRSSSSWPESHPHRSERQCVGRPFANPCTISEKGT